MTALLDRLAQAGLDALEAAERRGFDRAIALVEEKLKTHPHLCIHLSSQYDTECSVRVEIVIDADSDWYLASERASLSSVIHGQWRECKGSTADVAASVQRSVVEVERIIEHWPEDKPHR